MGTVEASVADLILCIKYFILQLSRKGCGGMLPMHAAKEVPVYHTSPYRPTSSTGYDHGNNAVLYQSVNQSISHDTINFPSSRAAASLIVQQAGLDDVARVRFSEAQVLRYWQKLRSKAEVIYVYSTD